jgi:hypothetical protein
MQERRKAGRARVLKGAKIILGNTSLLDCIVRNVTNGARLQTANTVDLPEKFDVTLDDGFTVRPSRVVWRTITETGVEFV